MVYNRFMENEGAGWGELDDILELLGYLTDVEIVREAIFKYIQHSEGNFRCERDHDRSKCFAPHILEAVGAIIKLFEETGNIHPKNAYILTYYLAMTETRLIFSEKKSV